MTRVPVPVVRAFAVAAALALSATACGSGAAKAACDKLQSTIQDVGKQGMAQIADPNGMAQTYANAATIMRQEGKTAGDGSVEQAANHAASALEALGQQVKSAASSTSTVPQMPSMSELISAGQELKQACGA
jgi:hypothetical protein